MSEWLNFSLALMLLLSPVASAAHEFWMVPGSFQLPPGGKTSLTVASGEDFRGLKVTFSAPGGGKSAALLT
jgi:hypothetical protein